MDNLPEERDRAGRFLLARIRETIPVAARMEVNGLVFDGASLRLSLPLASNHNDKGTVFAGSSYSLMVLASWALVTLILEQAGANASVVVASATVEYPRPLAVPEPVAVARLGAGESPEAVVRRFHADGKVKVQVEAQITGADGQAAASFRGMFAARSIPGG